MTAAELADDVARTLRRRRRLEDEIVSCRHGAEYVRRCVEEWAELDKALQEQVVAFEQAELRGGR